MVIYVPLNGHVHVCERALSADVARSSRSLATLTLSSLEPCEPNPRRDDARSSDLGLLYSYVCSYSLAYTINAPFDHLSRLESLLLQSSDQQDDPGQPCTKATVLACFCPRTPNAIRSWRECFRAASVLCSSCASSHSAHRAGAVCQALSAAELSQTNSVLSTTQKKTTHRSCFGQKRPPRLLSVGDIHRVAARAPAERQPLLVSRRKKGREPLDDQGHEERIRPISAVARFSPCIAAATPPSMRSGRGAPEGFSGASRSPPLSSSFAP